MSDFTESTLIKVIEIVKLTQWDLNMNIVLGYASYFILGYYLNKVDLSKIARKIIYGLGLIGFVLTICLSSVVTLKTQISCENYFGYFNVNVMLESMAVFVWFKYRKHSVKLYPLIKKLSKFSFGAYLVHVLIIDQLNIRFGLNTLSFNPILAVGFIGVIVFVVSYVISAILNHILVIKNI